MTETKPNPVGDGVRAFYEFSRAKAATELPSWTWPEFDNLSSKQFSTWALAYASTTETAVRMSAAMLSIGLS